MLALQEATVVGMADGYAQATGRPAFLNLHTSAGLGNAIGNLTNARANRTPLVVTAGQQDYRHIVTDPLLSGPLVELAGGTVKWGHEVRTSGELGTVLRRAFHDAAHPPAGPVFVSLPMDQLDQEAGAGAGAVDAARRQRGRRPRGAGRPPHRAGGRVAWRSWWATRSPPPARCRARSRWPRRWAPRCTARRSTAAACSRRRTRCGRACSLRRPRPSRAVLGAYERVLLIAEQAFTVYPYTPGPAVPPEVELLHLSPDPAQLGRAWPVRLGVAGHPRATLDALLPLVRGPSRCRRGGRRAGRRRPMPASSGDRRPRGHRARAVRRRADGPDGRGPRAVRALPPDTFVVDEAITTGVYVRGFHHWTEPGRYFFCTGGGLGWGMPAACGVSLGHGGAPVLCVVGDGSAMYSPQALWTAAAEQLPVVFAVVNNRQYKILKGYLRGMGGAAARTGRFIGMDLDDPPVDFLALARSMAVDATALDHAGDVGRRGEGRARRAAGPTCSSCRSRPDHDVGERRASHRPGRPGAAAVSARSRRRGAGRAPAPTAGRRSAAAS